MSKIEATAVERMLLERSTDAASEMMRRAERLRAEAVRFVRQAAEAIAAAHGATLPKGAAIKITTDAHGNIDGFETVDDSDAPAA